MKLTAKIKLIPTPEQEVLLRETMARANSACDYISQVGFENETFKKYDLQNLTYHDVREQFKLSAQMVIRCLGKVADSYKVFSKKQRRFRTLGAIAYDNRILKYKTEEQKVSIWTLEGRQEIPYAAGKHQLEMLPYQKGESKLLYSRGNFYLLAVCEVEETPEYDADQFLGVDLGIVNIAADSDGETHSGSHINKARHRNRNLRKNLQKKGTKSAKRLLKKMSGREARFVHDTNHVLAKSIVEKAKRTQRGIALEDLKGIRSRARARKPQRTALNSWAFSDLGMKIVYKAKRAGVPIVYVNPAYTSQTCPCCGHISKKNRPNRDDFRCVECGYAAPADTVGAINIALRGADSAGSVNDPHAVGART